MISVVTPSEISRSDCLDLFSVRVSSAEVASSNSRIGGRLRMVRAIATRWRSPPESLRPRSPTRGLVAVRQGHDEVVDARELRGRLDLRRRRVGPAVRDVVVDRVVEQHRVLRDDADRARRLACVTSRTSWPSMRTAPPPRRRSGTAGARWSTCPPRSARRSPLSCRPAP